MFFKDNCFRLPLWINFIIHWLNAPSMFVLGYMMKISALFLGFCYKHKINRHSNHILIGKWMVICETALKKPFLNMPYWCCHIVFVFVFLVLCFLVLVFSCKEKRLLAYSAEITQPMHSEYQCWYNLVSCTVLSKFSFMHKLIKWTTGCSSKLSAGLMSTYYVIEAAHLIYICVFLELVVFCWISR